MPDPTPDIRAWTDTAGSWTAPPALRHRRLSLRIVGAGLGILALGAFTAPAPEGRVLAAAAEEIAARQWSGVSWGPDLELHRERAAVTRRLETARRGAKAGQAAAKGEAGEAGSAAQSRKAAPPPVFAVVHGQELLLPARKAIIVGFHEASYPVAFPMAPVGNLLVDDNVGKFNVVPAVAVPAAAPNYVIMSSRGRPHAATSAVDIVPADGEPVLSPVTGTVVRAEAYDLYGKYPDNRVEIVPDGRPDLTVTMLHVWKLRVKPGERVIAGESAIAKAATKFPFNSHVDVYAGGHPPHVHIEAKINR
ncbi:MAG: M23 family metallopeptidase [Actinobacteria bacterium]|nr:M23 family metallopeptidase [Actinomycetota bacterium]